MCFMFLFSLVRHPCYVLFHLRCLNLDVVDWLINDVNGWTSACVNQTCWIHITSCTTGCIVYTDIFRLYRVNDVEHLQADLMSASALEVCGDIPVHQWDEWNNTPDTARRGPLSGTATCLSTCLANRGRLDDQTVSATSCHSDDSLSAPTESCSNVT